MAQCNSCSARVLIAAMRPDAMRSPSSGANDPLGGRIQVYHKVFGGDDDYSVPDGLQRACQLNGAIRQRRQFALRAQRLLQVGNQRAHELHTLGGIEWFGSFRRRDEKACG